MMYDLTNPLDPETFCQKWIPRLTGIQQNQRGYRTACCQLLSFLLGKSQGTVANWFLKPSSKGYRQPEEIVGKYLRALDLIWEIEALFPSSFYLSQARDYLQPPPEKSD
jgi:hypothetical protein